MANDLRLSGAQTIGRSESDIRFNYNNLNQIVAAANVEAVSGQAQFFSSTGGAAWGQTLLPFTGTDSNHTDPAVDWTSDGTAWALTIAIPNNQIRAYSSSDGGGTWTFDGTPSGAQTTADKEMMWVDHSATSPHRDNIYVVWQTGPAWVGRRTAGAWQAPVQVSGAETTGGTPGADIKTNLAGDVFAFWPDTGSGKLLVVKSTDGGASFGAPVTIATSFGRFKVAIPAQANRKTLIYLSGAAWKDSTNDLVFATWSDLSGDAGCTSGSGPGTDVASDCKNRVWFSRSLDGGATWEAPRKLNDQNSKNDQFFQRLALDETSGDLSLVYYDTVNDPGRLKADVWAQSSVDFGVTWSSAVQVTSQPSNETVPGATGDQYGDYIGLTGYAGQYFACWTDSRNGEPEEIWGSPLPLVTRAATFQIHRDHYGQDEVDAARTQPGGPVIKTGFWLAVDGFTARELGITGPGSTNLGPAITFNPSAGVFAVCTSLDSTDPTFSPDLLARFRFGYDLNFGPDDSAFGFAGQTEPVTISATFQGLQAAGQITFMKQPDPYVLQGPQTWWLSNDVRLIQVAQGDAAFGVTMGADPVVFLQQVTGALEAGAGVAGGQTFDQNTAEDNEVISVAPQTMRGGQLVNVYNFAVARVHYQALSQPANDVRVFFRLFAANSTATDFHPDTTYSRDPSVYPVPPANFGQHTTPTAGVIAGEYVSVPCFAAPRQDATQAGAANSLPSLQFD
ncbi:MAG TPA: sialidase family protein, partial [Rhodopila sp.]